MAGMAPFFLNGANAKIKVNGRTIAFCLDVSYSVIVNHAAPKILGMYESHTLEPLSYDITGSLTVVKYTAGMKDVAETHSNRIPDHVDEKGNGVGAWGPQGYQGITGSLSQPNDGMAHQSLIPKFLKDSVMFDIEIFQKVECGDIQVAKIRNVRLTRNDFKLTKRGVAFHTYQFMANYVDEDTFNADFSGVGQNLG